MFLAWLLALLGFSALASRLSGQPLNWPDAGRRTERSALDIAAERYARGEISREEYQQIRSDLET